MTTSAAQRPAAVRTWPCAICGHEIQKADGVDSRPTGRRFCRDENACRARVEGRRAPTIKEAGMPEVPDFVQEATAALAPLPDPTSARLAAAEAVLSLVARASGLVDVATAVALDVDTSWSMPATVQTHAEFTQDDPVSPVRAHFPARILAQYALGLPVTPLDRSDDF